MRVLSVNQRNERNHKMSIKIIGAGFPRTGTNTLKRSLEMLGYEKTYHFKDLMNAPENLHYWQSLQDTGDMKWDEIYEGYQASVDFPCYPWYKEHLKRYPDAKVILTVRTFESWYESMSKTIWVSGPQTPLAKMKLLSRMPFDARLRKLFKCIKFVKNFLFNIQFEGRFEDKDFVQGVWERHLEEVKSVVPKDQLLVFDVRDGWEPLCTFLGVEQPGEPLPHLNKKENFKAMIQKILNGAPAH